MAEWSPNLRVFLGQPLRCPPQTSQESSEKREMLEDGVEDSLRADDEDVWSFLGCSNNGGFDAATSALSLQGKPFDSKAEDVVSETSFRCPSVHQMIMKLMERSQQTPIQIRLKSGACWEIPVHVGLQPSYDEMWENHSGSSGPLPLYKALIVFRKSETRAAPPRASNTDIRANYCTKQVACHGFNLFRIGGDWKGWKRREPMVLKPWKFSSPLFPDVEVILVVPFCPTGKPSKTQAEGVVHGVALQTSGKRKAEADAEDLRSSLARSAKRAQRPGNYQTEEEKNLHFLKEISQDPKACRFLRETYEAYKRIETDGNQPGFRILERLISSFGFIRFLGSQEQSIQAESRKKINRSPRVWRIPARARRVRMLSALRSSPPIPCKHAQGFTKHMDTA